MNPSDCPLYDKCHYVQKCGDKMCPQDDCGKYGRYISRLQGAREFAEWLCGKSDYTDIDINGFITCRCGDSPRDITIEQALSEWQKGAEK